MLSSAKSASENTRGFVQKYNVNYFVFVLKRTPKLMGIVSFVLRINVKNTRDMYRVSQVSILVGSRSFKSFLDFFF